MTQYKTQHYVPQYYLRLFSADRRKLWMYNLTNDICKKVAIKNVCASNYFYSTNPDFEKLFSRLEGFGASLLNKIIDSESLEGLSQNDLNELNVHILFQYGRTKYNKDFAGESANHLFDIYKDTYKSEIIESGQEKGINITGGDIDKYKINPEWAFSHWLVSSLLSAPCLYDLNRILLMNKSNTDFICSDNPVILFNSFFNKREEIATRGVASKGLQVFYPISSKLMILMYDSAFYELDHIKSGHKILMQKNKDVQRLNGLQIINADNNVFFENHDMSSKVNTRFNELRNKIPEQKVNAMNSNISNFYMLPSRYSYNLEKLSFLEHKDTSEEYGIRNIEMKKHVSKFIDSVLKGEITDKGVFLEFLGLEA